MNGMQLTASAYRTPLTIAFAFVATHNHFVLDRGGKVFNRSAPVIKLPEGATEDDHSAARRAELVDGLLLAQAEQPQQRRQRHWARHSADEAWMERYEFTGTTLQDSHCLPSCHCDRGRLLDALARELTVARPCVRVRESVFRPLSR